jgi:hypothetical protein
MAYKQTNNPLKGVKVKRNKKGEIVYTNKSGKSITQKPLNELLIKKKSNK